MGVRDIKSISMGTSLSELGMDALMAVEIRQTMEREFGLILTTHDLRALTFLKLQEFSDENLKKENNVAIVNNNLGDETILDINHVMVVLSKGQTTTKLFSRITSKNNDECFDSCVAIFPGVEGATALLHNIAGRTNLPVFMISYDDQIKYHVSLTSPIEKDLIETFKTKKFFYLVGYSYGSSIAIECARILESYGMKGLVVCIDGSPILLKKMIQNFVKTKDVTDEKIQFVLISHLMQAVYPEENLENIRRKMEQLKTWERKLDKLAEFINGSQLEIDIEYLKTLCNGVYNRTIAAHLCETDNVIKIRSPIVLIRPTDAIISDIDEDYELQRYTDGLFTLKFIDGNHQSILENPKLIEIIDEMDPNSESRKDFVNVFVNK